MVNLINIFLVVCLIVIIILIVLVLKNVKYLIKGTCNNVEDFKGDGDVYTKKLNIITLGELIATLTFKKDGTFTIQASIKDGKPEVYTDNKWIYEKETCSLSIRLSDDLQKEIAGSPVSVEISDTIELMADRNIKIKAIILGGIPLILELSPNKK
jgi:hypothetical protein